MDAAPRLARLPAAGGVNMCPPARWLVAIAILATVPACTSYQALADPVADLATYPSPVGPARVTLRSGGRVKFVSLQVEGDSLRGALEGGGSRTFALTYIQKVELRAFDSEKNDAWAGVAVCTIFSAFGGECESGDAEE